MRACVFIVLILIALFVSRTSAQGNEQRLKNYVLFPIKTELQRTLVSSTADVHAEFDVAQAMTEGKFDLRRVDREQFQADLAAMAKQTGAAKPRLQIYFRYAEVPADRNEMKTVEDAVTPICHQAGFDTVRTGMTFGGVAWQDMLAKFTKLVDDDNATESPFEDEFIRVYPVRTKLSRFRLGDSAYDCFIELRQPIDGRFSEFSDIAREAIARRVAELKLSQKRKLSFRCMTTEAGAAAAERYFFARNGQPALVDSLVKELGFENCTITRISMSVSPEDLLGKEAPDFTLDALAGGQIHFHEASRGRVALIAFWGVACGACRSEAPHLTLLHDQYQSKGLFVVAVNGYDESKENVDQYAREKKLTHPIALMGGKVAEEKYTVASYPVTYLVDHRGKIVDYHLGFEPGDETLLEKSLRRLLAERESPDNIQIIPAPEPGASE